MVLRIKELLYEDQYTIAGAKKRLTNELRGASKLKVVTPEMSAQATQAAPQLVPAPAPPPEDEPHPYADTHAETQELAAVEHPNAPEVELNEDRRDALRHLREHLRELLVLLEASDGRAPTRPRS
jgi:hypothetical protein